MQFVPLYQGAVVRLAKLEPWIRTWWREILIRLSTKDWFEQNGKNLLWDPPTDAEEIALEL